MTNPLHRVGSGARSFFGALVRNGLIVTFAIIAAVLIAVFFLGLSYLTPRSPGNELPISAVTSKINSGQVATATLRDQDARIEIRTIAKQEYWSAYPHSDAYTTSLIDKLARHNVHTEIDQQSSKPYIRSIIQYLVPILVLVSLFGIITLVSRSGGAGAFAAFSKWTGKGKGGKKQPGRTTFADVAGAPEALTELREVVEYLENPERYARLGARAPKGVLLTGPPGTGKTLLARAVAGESNANFFSLSGSEFVESLVGVGAARVRDLFRQARKAAPAIIFIDELDAAGRQRGAGMGQGNDEREQTLNQMLVEMDGFGAESGIVVMGATNRPDILDSALLRPGRFDRQVVVDLPDFNGRLEIVRLHARNAPLSPDADLERVAHQTPGFSGADLANLINEASLLAVRAGKEQVEQYELEEAIDRVLSGPERKSHLLGDEERLLIATHEAGHAIVARSVGHKTALQKLSIVARGRGRGGSAVYASADKTVLSHVDLMQMLITNLGGAAAEDLVYGMLSTGVEDDLHAATKLARAMVASYGMSPAIGPVAIGEPAGEVFIGRDLANMGNVAPETLKLVDSEVRRMVQDAEETAREVLELNRGLLDEVARSLVEHETLTGAALEVYLDATTIWPEPLVDTSPETRAPGARGRARARERLGLDGPDAPQGI